MKKCHLRSCPHTRQLYKRSKWGAKWMMTLYYCSFECLMKAFKYG